MRCTRFATLPLVALWVGLMLVAAPSSAASPCKEASTAFEDAASAYMKSGPQAFIERFLQGSAFAVRMGATEAIAQLQQIEDVHGALQGWSSLSLKELGPRSCYLVASLEYVGGPAFTAVLYYAKKEGAVPISTRLEADPEKIFSVSALIDDRAR